jgi:diadenosine tetraphosphate (Ap4A) HIT family hydrolase
MQLQFGAYKINEAHVFFQNALIYAFVNLKPLIKNHVLLATKRNVQHIHELTDDELNSLQNNARLLSPIVGEQCTIGI